MKKKFILVPAVGIFLYLSLSSHWYGPGSGIGGSNVEATGASGTAGCTCHNPTSTSTTAVTISLLNSSGATVTSYVPGTTYTLKIHGVNNSSNTLPRFGFQLAVVKSTGAGTSSAVSTGTFGTPPTSGTHTVTVSGTSVTVYEHYNSAGGDGSIAPTTGSGGTGSTYDTSISWTAPVAGTGNVIIYGVENLVDHDGHATSSDQWNTATPVTICEAPSAITGTLTVCAGATTTLSSATTGGTWSSGATGIATVGSTGIVSGVSGGTAVISYSNSCGSATATVTVNAVSPGNSVAGGGSAQECVGSSSLILSNINPGGTWSSASSGVASVSGGTITGVTSGTAVISYTLPSTGCAATTRVTINAIPTISGTLSACIGATSTLTGSPSGGTWSTTSSNVNLGTASGTVAGVSSGTAVITYTSTSGCTKTATFTVNPVTAPISGTLSVCQGSTTILTDATPGGSWTTGSSSIATVISGGTTGTVHAVATGSTSPATTTITYLPPTGCSVFATLTVNPVPAAITPGTATVCPGATTGLTESTTGGTWSSSATGIATVGSTGIVTGVSGGSATISYTLSGGCSATTSVSVNASPPAITGSLNVCPAATDTLFDAGSGSWSSSAPAFATIDPTTGVVTGITGPGTTVITFTDGVTSCTTTATVNISAASSPITGTLNVCAGTTSTLSETLSGTWTSSTTGVATVTSPGSSVTLTGISPGTTLISYQPATGCGATATVTVNPGPGPITGSTSICVGGSATLSAPSSPGGTWSSSATGIATIGSSTGILNGVSAGTCQITYTLPSGCFATMIVTVNALPTVAPITGTLNTCVASTTTLSDVTSSGVWSSGTTSIATVGSSTGIVTGAAAGTSIIAYTVTSGAGCSASASAIVTVNSLPASISGTTNVCAASTRLLNETTAGGTWSSSNASIATVTPSGLTTTVTGVTGGTVTISYTLSTGCARTTSFTVNALPVVGPVTGTTGMCQGATYTLADTTAGGTWSSSNTSVAPIGSASGTVTASSVGTSNISYTVTNGSGCVARSTVTVTVNAAPGSISGATSVCTGNSITVSELTSGGTWSSGSSSTATVGSTTGTSTTVTGVSAGTVVISYTTPAGCFATKSVTVNQTPAAITGTPRVCVGQATSLADITPGGTWTSSNGSLATVGSTGTVTGVASGTPSISYTISGCSAVQTVTVNPLSSIGGLSSACAGASTTLTDATPGGTWSSATTSVATIGSSGILSTVGTGTSIISYSLPTGCVATLTFTVISSPSPISGLNHVCLGSTTSLTDPGGGSWTSSAPGIASVGSASGVVTGVTLGTATITYSLGSGCNVTLPMTVNSNPSAISGTVFTECVGRSITLTDATSGGTWSSSSSSVIVGSSSGSVLGVSAGTPVITYTSSLGCSVFKTITVNALPALITGTTNVCVSSTTTLADATSGGTWTSSSTGTATIGATSGTVSGIAAGTTTISYTLTGTGCATSTTVTVNPLPAGITGTANVCVGSSTTLADATTGGAWSASPSTTATIGSSSGSVSSIAAGTATVTYTLSTGCARTTAVTVNALPTSFTVTGGGAYCAGGSGTHIGLSGSQTGVHYQASTGGLPVGGSVSGTGTSLDLGLMTTAGIYTVFATNTATGCTAVMTGAVTVSINPLPSPITGTAAACQGASSTLSDATTGGTWSSGTTSIATVGSTGTVTGVSAGTSIISYTDPTTSCSATTVFTVNPLPATISGTPYVCAGYYTTLTETSTGGTWTTTNTIVASVGSISGGVAGLVAGLDTVVYTLPTSCRTSISFTVNPLPFAGFVTGPSTVCVGSTIALSDTASGGVWSSFHPSIATIGSTGVVTGVSGGADTISYTVTNSCGSATSGTYVTVNPLAVSGTISGLSMVCMGSTPTFTDPVSGGVWTSTTGSVASIGSGTGIVTPVSPGIDTIRYTVTNVCNSATASAFFTVNPLPSAGTITGVDSVCESDTLQLSNTVNGGLWSASNTNATVSSTGLVSGITPGTDTIIYTVTNDCGSDRATLLVRIIPHAICATRVNPVNNAAGEFKVYPNPSGGSFTVEMPVTIDKSTIDITDVLGREITSKTVDAGTQKTLFELRNIAAGSYFVNVHSGDKVFRAKLVIW